MEYDGGVRRREDVNRAILYLRTPHPYKCGEPW